MEMKHISFPSIEQYRNVVKMVRDRAQHNGVPLPTIRFTGTVKLHGTNAGIGAYIGSHDSFWAQSRSNVITVENDNAGFARFIDDNEKSFKHLVHEFALYAIENKEAYTSDTLMIYGEWCGQGVQKGVAISQLPKMFVIFGVALISKIADKDDNDINRYRWFNPGDVQTCFDSYLFVDQSNVNIKCIYDYDTWELDIDFSNPEAQQNLLGRYTEVVEQRCPVGANHGIEGTGEGIVWKASSLIDYDGDFYIDDLIFKVKGEKHSITRVKTLASVDIEKVNNVKQFADNVLTEARLNQGLQSLKEQGLEPVVENTGAFLKWIGSDVIKEESDTMEGNGLDRKDVMPVINREARQWYMKQQL